MAHWPEKLPPCPVCLQSKLTRTSVKHAQTHVESDAELEKGQRLDVDLIGPMPATPSGKKYAIQPVDRKTRYVITEAMNNKDQSASIMTDILDRNLTPFGRVCTRIHADRGGEFTGGDWTTMCNERRIKYTWASTATPEHNGLAERIHRTTVEKARAMLIAAGLPISKYWVEALKYATYLYNISPNSALPEGTTPYEQWTGEKPRIANLKIFGSRVYYLTPDNGKFGKQGEEGIYLGPDFSTVGGAARVYCPSTKRIVTTRDYKVIEIPIGPQRTVTSADTQEPAGEPQQTPDISAREPTANPKPADIQDKIPDSADKMPTDQSKTDKAPRGVTVCQPSSQSEEGDAEAAQRAEKKRRKAGLRKQLAIDMKDAPQETRGRHTRTAKRLEEGADTVSALLAADSSEPITLKEARKRPDAEQWLAAARDEIQSLIDQRVWETVPRPKDRRITDSKWVFKLKRDENNRPIRYKCRVTARGFTQVPGVDYNETSAPVCSKEGVRTVFALAAQRKWLVEQFDIKTAYLYATLEETIYMEPPSGFLELWGDKLQPSEHQTLQEGGVLRLKKALYGLKQSGRRWFETIRDYLRQELGLTPTESEPCIFVSDGIILVLYVDDILIFAPTQQIIDSFFSKIVQRFDLKRMGTPKFFLGWAVQRGPNGSIHIDQHGYVSTLGETYAADIRPKATPMTKDTHLDPEGPAGDSKLYREIVGSLLFASIGTRPDISAATAILTQFMEKPTKAHVAAARNIASYARTTADLGLRYKSEKQLRLEVYCDASFAPPGGGRKSRTGYMVMINGTPVAWKSRRQDITAMSTAESEYIAMSEAARDAMYIKSLLQELGHDYPEPILVHEDNNTTKTMAEEIATKRSKHVDVRYHRVRGYVQSGNLKIIECRTEHQLADLLTKCLPKPRYVMLRDRFMAKGEC